MTDQGCRETGELKCHPATTLLNSDGVLFQRFPIRREPHHVSDFADEHDFGVVFASFDAHGLDEALEDFERLDVRGSSASASFKLDTFLL